MDPADDRPEDEVSQDGDGDTDEAEEAITPTPPSRTRILLAVVVAIAVTAAFLAGTVGALLRGGTQGDGAEANDAGMLAIVDLDGRLLVMGPDGTPPRQLPVPDTAFQFPAWSPDGSRIAAPVTRLDGSGAVLVVDPRSDASDSQPTTLYSSPDRVPFYLSWAPDGSHVAFLTSEPDSIALRSAPADASSPARVVRIGSPMYWDWIDDGHLFIHAGGTFDEAFVGEAAIGRESDATSSLRPGFFRPPALGGDRSYRAVVAQEDGASVISIETSDPADRKNVPVRGSVAMTFDPTGTSLAYTATDTDTSEPPPLPVGPLRLVDPRTGSERVLLDSDVVAFFWSPDGRTIATLRFPQPGDPGDSDLAATRVASADVDLAAEEAPGIPLTLAFLTAATGEVQSERAVRVSDVFASQVIPFFDQYALSHRIWSRNSRAILLPLANGTEPTHLVVIPADESTPSRVADGIIGFWSP
jgi:TolB protein